MGEFQDAHDKKEAAAVATLQHEKEQAENRSQVDTLLKKVAEDKLILIESESRAEERAREQWQVGQRIRQEQKSMAQQNAIELQLQTNRTQLVDKEEAAATRVAQHVESVRIELAQASQSAQDLNRSL